MRTSQSETEPRPGFHRIKYAAAALNMSPEMLESAAERGELALEVIRIGPRRVRFVRASDLQRVLDSHPTPNR